MKSQSRLRILSGHFGVFDEFDMLQTNDKPNIPPLFFDSGFKNLTNLDTIRYIYFKLGSKLLKTTSAFRTDVTMLPLFKQ